MRVVLDTNVFISSLVYGNEPRAVHELMLNGTCELIVSNAILGELEKHLLGKFGWEPEVVALAIMDIRSAGITVRPEVVVTDCVDPDDNRILEAAVAGGAAFIVSGTSICFE
jgi:uncharacterized protein